METKMTVEEKVRMDAKSPISTKLNLNQYKREKALAMMHKVACQQVVNFADAHEDMPFYAVMEIMVGSGSWKNSEYAKGYKKADYDKASTIYEMALAYQEHNGLGTPTDVTWRIVRRYYDKVSRNYDDFMSALLTSKPSDDARGHFKEQCENLGIYK